MHKRSRDKSRTTRDRAIRAETWTPEELGLADDFDGDWFGETHILEMPPIDEATWAALKEAQDYAGYDDFAFAFENLVAGLGAKMAKSLDDIVKEYLGDELIDILKTGGTS